MPEYTESQIRELSGRELWAATRELCGLPADADVSSLDVCVPLLMGEGKPLSSSDLCVGEEDEWWIDMGFGPVCISGDPATAVCRAACLVALREGE